MKQNENQAMNLLQTFTPKENQTGRCSVGQTTITPCICGEKAEDNMRANAPDATVSCDAKESGEATSQNYKFENKLARDPRHCDLHTACRWGTEWIPSKDLEEWISKMTLLDRRNRTLKNVEREFHKTCMAFRDIPLVYNWDVEGRVCIEAKLRPTLQILGLACPKADDSITLYEAVRNFCSKVGIVDEEDTTTVNTPDGGYEHYVPARAVIGIIKKAGFPRAISERLSKWYTAFLDEREASASWCAPPDYDFFLDIDEDE